MNVKAIGLIMALAFGGGAGAAGGRPVANPPRKVVVLERIDGKVLGIRGDTLYLDRNGTAIPLKVTAATALDDALMDRDIARQLRENLTEGQQVRATYGLEGTQNVAVFLQSGRREAAGARP